MNHFKCKQFQKDVIILAVSYYLRFNLSYRDVQEMLSDRGIEVCYSTIQRWVKDYGPLLYQLWKRKTRTPRLTGRWMKPTSKLKGNGTISIVPSMLKG